METWECARCGAEVENTAEHPEIGCDFQSLPNVSGSKYNQTNKKKRKLMENFDEVRSEAFQEWYAQFGETLYRDTSKEVLERIFNFGYVSGALAQAEGKF